MLDATAHSIHPHDVEPRSDYRVELDAYSGPLDLLLYLVRKNEIDLHNIPIAALTEQYLAYLEKLKEIDLDVAGEFLVMAATLLEIKSRMLVPAEARTEGDDVEHPADPTLDPRYELVQQLLAYKRYRDAAGELEDRLADWEQRAAARAAEPSARRHDAGTQTDDDESQSAAAPLELELEDVSVLDLCEAFARILDSIGSTRSHEVLYDDTPIALHAEDIVDRLRRDAPVDGMDLQAMFAGRSRSEAIGLFLAMLELVRQRRITARQDDRRTIRLVLLPETDDDAANADDPSLEAFEKWRDPETGQITYDWPDEQTRRRAQRRAERLARHPFAAAGGDNDDVSHDDVDATEASEDGGSSATAL